MNTENPFWWDKTAKSEVPVTKSLAPIPDPQTFAQLMQEMVNELSWDPEGLHNRGEDMLCDLLSQLGYEKAVKIYLEAPKY